MNDYEDFASKVVGNGILIIMFMAIFFGNTQDIGYAAMVDVFILLGWLLYMYMKHPDHFKSKK
ncbi:hypothetical protein [Acidithiobacillus thiooxidans]|jgi:hypothetical protein|uniref:Uncharacterized protein n=2 Tax=Acidithiobacillus thiooxidans TaxID=930 RepID=A0A543Q287_ACITH|nr:hypothetical protein [Acidithiobacillus thiooxidans]MBU2750575.1 hypothetical protein [Acidithiobacillus thiooxidans]MBU2836267.1 hypothetical protein [Acidithiobacillus thiooxidans]MDX5935431.1 hypothetical protein [Acidithiobacillus thiooxidans]OCX67475.1 hypothetical protein A6O24_20785 [Acidithiobacillus thiooxidans]OCX76918.1 hypothetical protein A6P07_01260 [Acidithiobacillus thiooxidans]